MEISRSERKRRSKQIETLVVELSRLQPSIIDQLPCDKEIHLLLKDVSSLKAGARKRQLKYITKFFRNESLDEVYDFMTRHRGPVLQEKKQFHEIEFFRDSLLAEALTHRQHCLEIGRQMEEKWPSRVIEEIKDTFPHADLFGLLRLALIFSQTRDRKYKREIFSLLRAAAVKQQYKRCMDAARNNKSANR